MEFTAIRASTAAAAGCSSPPPAADHKAEEEAAGAVEKEHMFDKVVTPSDVGKLNRLVIPKQHAEKYFPLDTSSTDKGLLLSFEDRAGKPWRFRYSYWNSSQSYVMTKGWSRFVKEKRLDAGDTQQYHHQHPSLVLESVPVRMSMAAAPAHPEPSAVATSGSKRVRLFGVNLECAADAEEDFSGPGRTATTALQLLSPASSSSSSSGKARCSLNLDL
ncbi:unnamed protein product [Triticum turgidum subsp. durum]|uniref:TF-B3 domain-containing protein n=1 Tax=Triticum turgidum subsp. durum TaxID=4567 RepID=A0A9R0TBW6_TRITD|nr:unnamed protein product [Triticum turgidum subsp. durum]